MNLMKFDPFRAVANQNSFDQLFNRSIADFVGSDYIKSIPSVNVSETEANFNLEVAAPGLSKEDFKLSIEKNQLTISSEKESSEETNEGKVTRKEFNYSKFQRSFYLPKTVDKDAIVAKYENGVLNVSLPKKPEVVKEEQGRQIEIQ